MARWNEIGWWVSRCSVSFWKDDDLREIACSDELVMLLALVWIVIRGAVLVSLLG